MSQTLTPSIAFLHLPPERRKDVVKRCGLEFESDRDEKDFAWRHGPCDYTDRLCPSQLTSDETFNWLSSQCILKQNHSGGDSVALGIIVPPPPLASSPPPPTSPPLHHLLESVPASTLSGHNTALNESKE